MAFTAVATVCWGSSCDAPALPLPRHSPQLASSFPQQQQAAGMTALYLPLPCWPGTSTQVFGSTALQADRPAPVRCVNTPRPPNSPDCYSADHLVSKRQRVKSSEPRGAPSPHPPARAALLPTRAGVCVVLRACIRAGVSATNRHAHKYCHGYI